MTGTITPEAYTGTDSARINAAVQAAAAAGAPVVIPRVNRGGDDPAVWRLDEVVRLPSGAHVTLDGCVLKLSDRCRDNFFRSANCGVGIRDIAPLAEIHLHGANGARLEGADHPRATGDSDKTLGMHTYGTDAGVAGASQRGDWRNIGILLAGVRGFSITGLAIHDPHAWAISLEHCADGRLADLHFSATGHRVIDGQTWPILNQDGIDLRRGCHAIVIEGIRGVTGDDIIALTAIPHAAAEAGTLGVTEISAAVPGAGIHHVTIRDVRGHCAGGHHLVRFLNTAGLPLHDVTLDGLTDTAPEGLCCRAAVKIGDANPAWGGVTPLGDTCRVTIRNVAGRGHHAVLIAGSLADSTLCNVGTPVTLSSGAACVRNVAIL
jgi:hypothetical protein